MSSGKEIRTKIKSVQNTQKITRAMEMVAASKMRRVQENMQLTRPYATHLDRVVRQLSSSHSEYPHPYLNGRAEVGGIGVILVSTDRGLCGGLNINLFKSVLRELSSWQERGVKVRISAIGRKGASFFSRLSDIELVAQTSGLGDRPRLADIIGPVSTMLTAYDEGRIDRLYLVGNRFVNTMTQKPHLQLLLPVPSADEENYSERFWDYIYEPEAPALIREVLRRYIDSLVYQMVVENLACEMAARMVAMKSASDNAGTIIDDLQLAYNKARQAAITQEIAEIVGGAAAV